MWKIIKLILVIAATIGVIAILAPRARADENDPLRILVIGDSRSTSCTLNSPDHGWCSDLKEMLVARNIPVVIDGYAIGGLSCQSLRAGSASKIDTFDPDLVIMACGTNDAPNTQAAVDAMGWSWRWMVEYAHNSGAMVLPVFVQYSNVNTQERLGRHWLVTGEPIANDVIYINMLYYMNAGWFPGIADLQRVPGSPDYLLPDGIHPNDDGHYTYASIYYRALRGYYNWPDSVAEPCGMWGSRQGYAEPSFIPCPVRAGQG